MIRSSPDAGGIYSFEKRVGGDEFAVICRGQDYDRIDHLLKEVSEANEQSRASGDILIACGMARYRNGETVEAVFERADHQMYQNKNHLKA